MIKHIYKNIQGWFDFPTFYKNLAEELPNNFNFAEVGVWKGRSLSHFVVSCIMVKELKNIGNIYAIDHWKGSQEHNDKNSKSYEKNLSEEGELFKEFITNMDAIKDYIKIIKQESSVASTYFLDNFFDSVFIDASHDYKNVFNDLNCWYPKIKKNGILAGHDYSKQTVHDAVFDFAKIKNIEIYNGLKNDKINHTNNNIWVMYKP